MVVAEMAEKGLSGDNHRQLVTLVQNIIIMSHRLGTIGSNTVLKEGTISSHRRIRTMPLKRVFTPPCEIFTLKETFRIKDRVTAEGTLLQENSANTQRIKIIIVITTTIIIISIIIITITTITITDLTNKNLWIQERSTVTAAVVEEKNTLSLVVILSLGMIWKTLSNMDCGIHFKSWN